MKKRFLYQPDLPTTIICWSYSLIVLLISILLWLEITVFQIWTVLVFLLFLVIAGLQIFFRRVEVTTQELILHTVIRKIPKSLRCSRLAIYNYNGTVCHLILNIGSNN
jgi:hypothetical protein